MRNRMVWTIRLIMLVGLSIGLELIMVSCVDEPREVGPVVADTTTNRMDSTTLDDGPIDFSRLADTYAQLASPEMTSQWAQYNVHDPSMLDDGKFVYCYNTDVAFGTAIRPGLQIRRSINLVEWEFVGWVFNSLPSAGSAHITRNGGTPNNSLWAPYAMKVGEEYRVYYSLASNVGRVSAIGLATSDDPRGPFREKGVVVTSVPEGTHTNAIDPTVIIDQAGNYWMYYGSSWDGIYIMQLDPETGLALRTGDIGIRIAHRGFTSNTINGNIEGPEIIYNEDQGMYYLFIAYDWLETKYNVRVGRSESPNGPFLDYFGQDLNEFSDDYPMILAPYQFDGHSGWQGVSHPAVFKKEGEFYMAHQGRPGVNQFYMVLHTRQVFWTTDGWPIVSAERFADEVETVVEESELLGTWEIIDFGYTVVPGFADTQTSPDFQRSKTVSIEAGGSITGELTGSWTYESPWLTLTIGEVTTQVLTERGRDWENEVASTVLFTGIKEDGLTLWGKKIQ